MVHWNLRANTNVPKRRRIVLLRMLRSTSLNVAVLPVKSSNTKNRKVKLSDSRNCVNKGYVKWLCSYRGGFSVLMDCVHVRTTRYYTAYSSNSTTFKNLCRYMLRRSRMPTSSWLVYVRNNRSMKRLWKRHEPNKLVTVPMSCRKRNGSRRLKKLSRER